MKRFIVADVGGGPVVMDTHAKPAALFCAPIVHQGPLPAHVGTYGLSGDEWKLAAEGRDTMSRAHYLCELLNRDHDMRQQVAAVKPQGGAS